MKLLYLLAQKQRKLNNAIYRKHKISQADVYEEQKIALLVELGELANELQFFKYWKDNPVPKFHVPCKACQGTGKELREWGEDDVCVFCEGTGKDTSQNPVLEEYVDVLHFMLTATLNKFPNDIDMGSFLVKLKPLQYPDLTQQFSSLYYHVANNVWVHLDMAWRLFLGLGKMLGFSEDDVMNAYEEKNKENYARQERGY